MPFICGIIGFYPKTSFNLLTRLLDIIKMRGKNMFHFLMNIFFNLSVKQHTCNTREKSDTIIMNTTKILYVSQKCQKLLCVAPCHNKSVSLVNWPSDRAVKQGCLLKVSELHMTTHNIVCIYDTMFRGYNINAWKVIMLLLKLTTGFNNKQRTMLKLNIIEYWDDLIERMSAEINFVKHIDIVHRFLLLLAG